jgi:glycosyltransferase involved in cell wall biosynthesis
VLIPHGAAIALPSEPPIRLTQPTILTWGLLGEGKGIEWAIDAMRLLRDLRPRPQYVIAGDTHPKVLAREGERYREMLVRRTWEQGVSPVVKFDRGYRDLPALSKLIDRATVVLLPYDSQDQVTSGVLVDAVAAGRPVVSTAFPHAVELLASGAGIVVPQRDPVAIAAALRRVLTEDGLATAMAAEAAKLAPELGWDAVAGRYHALADPLVGAYAEVPA